MSNMPVLECTSRSISASRWPAVSVGVDIPPTVPERPSDRDAESAESLAELPAGPPAQRHGWRAIVALAGQARAAEWSEKGERADANSPGEGKPWTVSRCQPSAICCGGTGAPPG